MTPRPSLPQIMPALLSANAANRGLFGLLFEKCDCRNCPSRDIYWVRQQFEADKGEIFTTPPDQFIYNTRHFKEFGHD